MINTREDWIDVGFEILVKEGISSVKIERMASKLGVTKGGFYGYFPNRNALLRAMLEDWEVKHSSEMFNLINGLDGSLADKLRKLLYTVDDIKYDAIELSIYNWAVYDPIAQEVLIRAVDKRLKWLSGLLVDEGFEQHEAEKRAHIIHHFMAGCKTVRPLLPASGSPERYEQLDHFLKQVIGSTD